MGSTCYSPLDLSRVRTVPLSTRDNKMEASRSGRVAGPGASFRSFYEGLPNVLAGEVFRKVVAALVRARRTEKPVIWAMGAHVIKCGLSPCVLDLMRRGIITAVALNGAGAIHDFEIALIGQTSEDVAGGLRDGTFGMSEETGRLINQALLSDGGGNSGMGAMLGAELHRLGAPFRHESLLAEGFRLGLPVTVHVAIGTDIVHMHPSADGAAIGAASFYDFRLLAAVVADLGGGGVHLNVGSAVVLPEVFLKALTVARNLGNPVVDYTTVNLDMLRQYRPLENVVRRPTLGCGQGYSLIGHHELMIPLLAQAVVEEMDREAPG
jgi:hypothetical protein